ncbi:hypothetical protein [Bacillus sp. EB600]|uniref:hypothetical protein n=1 Tax=Bacillus sp. EB600 TaxID=2806345 RepID=UPI00210A2919|nr:hypothetical protein [Bacillus sp. EB600]MCQ6277785.1 hypothetical protein [Bacillus sp. EB600]
MKKVVVFFLLIVLSQGVKEVNAANQISFQVEMLPWEEVNNLLPKYTKFTVMDVVTGKQFRVQRRAGSHHADVQPLTAKDTKIMKNIYGGKWSWKRRAIIIIYKDQWVAASMHGMPHGGGALKNNFPGHFCIHFYGSTTHRTNSMDLAHMLMIYKAAGRLEEYLGKANPYDVINAYVAGLKQQDAAVISQSSLQELKWKSSLVQIENVSISRLPMLPAEDLTNEISVDIPIEIDWYLKKIGRHTFRGEIHLVRFSQYQPWKIDTIHFFKENNIPIQVKKTSILKTIEVFL